jgi:HD-like signal output (HDOD) protein
VVTDVQMSPNQESSGTRIPPLSDALQRLLGLPVKDQQDLRVLELIVMKDPAAVARLTALADTVNFNRGGRHKTLFDALKAVGTQATYDALMSMWAVDLFEVPTHLRALRNYLGRHIFAMCGVLRRIAPHVEGGNKVDINRLTLASIVDKLSLALPMGADTGPELPTLLQFSNDRRHLFHVSPELQLAFANSVSIAEYWGFQGDVTDVLKELVDWEVRMPNLSLGTQMVLAGEALLDAKSGLGNRALHEEPFTAWPVIQGFYARNVDPMTLVPSY